MNDSYRNKYLNIVLRQTQIQEKFQVTRFQSQDTTPDPPCIIIIYLEYT